MRRAETNSVGIRSIARTDKPLNGQGVIGSANTTSTLSEQIPCHGRITKQAAWMSNRGKNSNGTPLEITPDLHLTLLVVYR